MTLPKLIYFYTFSSTVESLFTWVASSMCDHCIDKTILQKEVVTDIGARGIVALTAYNPLWASVPHLHLSKLDKRNRIKLWRELLGTLIWIEFMIYLRI